MKAATRRGLNGRIIKNISIHAAREGGDQFRFAVRQISQISIHAAREGGDTRESHVLLDGEISIHAAREGGDQGGLACPTASRAFQSTPPVKAATDCPYFEPVWGDISIHAAREGGDDVVYLLVLVSVISIHAAREGGDAASAATASTETEFQSTPPVKAATTQSFFAKLAHAYFNPRRP